MVAGRGQLSLLLLLLLVFGLLGLLDEIDVTCQRRRLLLVSRFVRWLVVVVCLCLLLSIVCLLLLLLGRRASLEAKHLAVVVFSLLNYRDLI